MTDLNYYYYFRFSHIYKAITQFLYFLNFSFVSIPPFSGSSWSVVLPKISFWFSLISFTSAVLFLNASPLSVSSFLLPHFLDSDGLLSLSVLSYCSRWRRGVVCCTSWFHPFKASVESYSFFLNLCRDILNFCFVPNI